RDQPRGTATWDQAPTALRLAPSVREHVPGLGSPARPTHPETPAFTPVIIAEQVPALAPSAPTPPKPGPAASIEIAIAAAIVRVGGLVDAKALAAVLRAVKMAS